MFSGALRLFFHANSARGLNIFPPQQKDNEVWLSAGDLMLAGLASKGERPWVREQLSTIQTLVNALKEGEGPFLKALQSFRTSQDAIAESRGEGIHSELEVTLYRGKWFTYSLYCFVFSLSSSLSVGSRRAAKRARPSC